MGATNPLDQFRLDLEDIIACCVQADNCLRVAQLRLALQARTDTEAEIMLEMKKARREVKKAHERLLAFHQDKRPPADESARGQ